MILLKVIVGFIIGGAAGIGLALLKEKMHSKSLDGKVDRYPIDRVDTNKMIADKAINNLSDRQVQRNMINGKYDKR